MCLTIDIEEYLATHQVTKCPTMRAKEWDDQDDDTPISLPCEGVELNQLAKQILVYGN